MNSVRRELRPFSAAEGWPLSIAAGLGVTILLALLLPWLQGVPEYYDVVEDARDVLNWTEPPLVERWEAPPQAMVEPVAELSAVELPPVELPRLTPPLPTPSLPRLDLATGLQGVDFPTWSAPVPVAALAAPSQSIFELGELDEAPRPLRNPHPAYPREAANRNIRAVITVEFIIESDGDVRDVIIVAREPETRLFDENVKETLSRWKFQPGRRTNRAVSSRARMQLIFKLDP